MPGIIIGIILLGVGGFCLGKKKKKLGLSLLIAGAIIFGVSLVVAGVI
jgi:LPXTG-motif cell wall-anchored protein